MAVDLSKIKKHELYKEGYNDVWNAKPQSTWEQVQEIANNNIQKSNRSIWDDIGNAFQITWRGLTSGVKDVPYYFANVQENNQQFVKDTEQQFLTNPKTSADEKAKLNNIGINQIAVANSDGEAKEKFKKNLETAKNEKPETNLIKKSIADSIQEDQEVINQKQEEIENPIVKKVAEVAPSIGQMIPGMTLSAINPGAGALYFMSSSSGGYIKDALDRGMNDKEARLYGTLMGVMEGATEMIGVENLSKAGRAVKTLVKGTGKEIAKEGVKELGKTTIKTALKDYGIGIADNVIQESLMEPVQETIAGLVGGKDKANWNNMGQRMLQSGINGGLCSAIMGGANMGINSCVAVVDKINNGQTPTQQEMQTATKDVNKKVNVENLIIESTQQQINKYKQNAEGNQIVTNLQNNLPQNTSNTPAEQQVQQTARQIEKVAQNGNMGQINTNVQNQQQIDRTEAVNSLKQRVEKELTGSEKTEILDFLNNTPNIDESSIKSITGLINMARNDILNTDETYKTGRQQKYVKYMNKTNEYDSSVLQQAKEIVPANNQGRRTKEQWLQIAEQIGNNIADKSATEIEEIAYRTWQEERPASKESLNRQGKKYVQFTSDDWINTIYNTVKKIDSQNAQTISQSQQVNQEQNNQQLQETDFTQPAQPNIQNYQYVKSDNTKIDNLRQDASKCLDNSEQTHNFVNLLEKFIQDKDVEIRLDDTLVDNNGKVANGKYQNGVIRINPNSTRAGEFIAIHELTHAIGTKDMMNIVENYRKSNTEFDNSVKELLKNYNQTEITEEALADVSAQLFGTQEFINNLSQENPSLFKKIYNEIKYLWHQFRGYKNQNQFIEDLQYKWEQAYRSNNELNNTTNYYIEPVAKFDELEYNNVKEVTLPKQEYAILSSIVNSDSNIKPGINYVEVTNGKYTIYYKETGKFKVMSKEVDENAGRISKRNDTTRGEARYSKSLGEVTENESSTGNNDEILNINSQGESERSGSDTSSTENIRNSIENSNQSSFSIPENIKKKIYDYINSSAESLDNDSNFITKEDIEDVIREGDYGYDSEVKEYIDDLYEKYDNDEIDDDFMGELLTIREQAIKDKLQELGYDYDEKDEVFNKMNDLLEAHDKIISYLDENNISYDISRSTQAGSFRSIYIFDNDGNEIMRIANHGNNETSKGVYTNKELSNYQKVIKDIQERVQQTEDSKGSSFSMQENLKQQQLEIIQNNNPMQDDYHTGIRNIEDIKTFEETLQDSDWADYDEFNPDYTRSMVEDAIKTGKITVYSSYPIEQGIFVSPSRMEAESYSANGKVYSKEVNLDDIAWIDPTQGQYAKVENNKYSKNNESWQEYLDNNFKSKGTRTDLQAIRLPTKENIKKVNQNKNIPTSQNVQQESAQKEPNVPLSKNMKQRKHYKSIIESNYTSAEAKKIAKEMMGTDTYVPESNKKQLARADQRIGISGAESELNSLISRATTGGNIKADDIAVGERLIQYYSKIGDKSKLQDAIQATAMAGTTAGQTVQALSMLNHQTPEGQAIWIQRSVDKMNNDLARQKGGEIVKDEDGNIRVIRKNGKDITDKVELFNLTPDMIDKIVNSKNTQDLQNNVNQIYEELGQQVTKSTMQKIDSWRYFSMLFNIRTHLRNVLGNTAMGATQKAKNKVAGIIEGVVSKVNPEMERTHTIVPASKEVKAFAKSDINNVADRLGLNDNKYNPKSRLENSMRTFKSNAMENTVGKLFKFNDNALEAEDGFGLKRAYRNALAEYMTANKLTPENITDSQLSKARNHAIEQAKEATFHQESKIASLLNQLQNKNKFAKATLDATLPFKKTPINVAKAGMEYSPAGLIKSIVYDSTQLRKGNITANQYIDNISKGLTGTGIALVGYALADMGILKASGGDDDKKEKYDEAMGNQTYAITIGDKTYSLDWLSPTGIPLFIGAELKQIVNAKAKTSNSSTDSDSIQNKIGEAGNNLINALSNAMSPMAEMSMLSGLTSTLQSYEQGSSQFLAELIGGGVQSYANQFIPTLSGQIAKTIDDKERSTTSTKTGVFSKKLDQTKNQMMNKIPGLRQMLPTKTDIWGNEIKQNENWVARAFENGVLPWAQKDKASSKVNEELNSIYEKTGESSIYPTTIEKKLTLNGENYRLTNEEFSKYQKDYGQTSYKLIDSLVNSNDYKNMTDTQKQKAIEEIYKYAKEKNKIDYAKKINKDVEESTLYKTLEELKTNGGSQSDYLNYTAKIEGVKKDKEKNEILSKSNYSNATKSIIYKNTTGSEDDLYNNLLSKDNINLDQYLNYKLQEFTSDKEDNGTLSGKSISGSKKKKVYDYVNNMDITQIQRVALIGSQYKLDRDNQMQLYNYINNIRGTVEEKEEIFKKFSSNFTIYKNGTLGLK